MRAAAVCGRCGARRVDQQLGLEALPFCATWERGPRCEACYICRMVEVFEEVKRVLRDDGTLWLNCGDSYATTITGNFGPEMSMPGDGGRFRTNKPNMHHAWKKSGLKPKDLCGIPWRLALALQAAGWYLRSEIIWAKKNCLPESVQDRPTKAHEQVFLLTKQPRYFYDADAVRENGSGKFRTTHTSKFSGDVPFFRTKQGLCVPSTTAYHVRAMRSVLSLASEPFPGAHFACFPTKLVEPCILAGTSAAGVCAACGSPWRRVVEREHLGETKGRRPDPHMACPLGKAEGSNTRGMPFVQSKTTGWTASCSCQAGTVPATILDPFCGSGTTMLTALQHGRHSIGIDLSRAYLDLALQCLTPALAQLPLFGLPGGRT